jgi:putative hydrolase of the HAD superfamily
MIPGVVFDLDDTLYFERDYVRSGFDAVAGLCASTGAVTREAAFELLWHDFEAGMRGDAFNRLFARFPELTPRHAIADLVRCYREHRPRLHLGDGVDSLLDALAAGGARLALLSDGDLVGQQAKVDVLALSARFSPLVLTGAWGPSYWKPHARGYEAIASALGLTGRELVYVADNPLKDFITPKKLGWQTVRLRTHEQLRYGVEAPTVEHEPDATVSSFVELRAWLGARR